MNQDVAQRDRQQAAHASDLIDHPGWHDVLDDVTHEAKAARTKIFTDDETVSVFRARGSLAVLKNIVLGVYRRANKPPPPQVQNLFE